MAIRKKRTDFVINKKKKIEHNGLYPYMQKYLEHEAVRQTSFQSLQKRESTLRGFIEFCDHREIHDPKEINRQIIERYRRHLFYYRKTNGSPLTASSQALMLSLLKTFFRWLTRQNHIMYNPASELELPRKRSQLPKTILTMNEIEKIFAQADINTVEGFHDRTAMELLYSTAIRRSELTNLKLFDVDTKRKVLFIQNGKNGSDRYVPIGDRALAWLEKYRYDIRKLLAIEPDSGYLFLTPWGDHWHAITFGNKIRRFVELSGIDKKGGSHLFRHAAATHMLEHGADIRFIQAFLGHKDLSTTEIYTHVSIEKLSQIHQSSHPMSTFHKSTTNMDDILAMLEIEAAEDDE